MSGQKPVERRKGIRKNVMSRKHKAGETICPIYGKAVEERYCLEECLLNDCGMLMRNHTADQQEGHAPDKKQ